MGASRGLVYLFLGLLWGLEGFMGFLLGFLLGFLFFNGVLLGFLLVIYGVFIGFYWLFMGFYFFSCGFTRFYFFPVVLWVLMFFPGFYGWVFFSFFRVFYFFPVPAPRARPGPLRARGSHKKRPQKPPKNLKIPFGAAAWGLPVLNYKKNYFGFFGHLFQFFCYLFQFFCDLF